MGISFFLRITKYFISNTLFDNKVQTIFMYEQKTEIFSDFKLNIFKSIKNPADSNKYGTI